MSTIVFMKILETAPSRYDKGIRILTLGKDHIIKTEIVNKYIHEKDYVLDIGTGTGLMAIACAQKGAKVLAFDASSKMLLIARERINKFKLQSNITLDELGVMETDSHIKPLTFDVVIACLVFSELSSKEQEFTLQQCNRVLKEGGILIIEDMTSPKALWKRLLHFFIRLPLSIITYIIAQSLPKTLKNFEDKLTDYGFKIEEKKDFLLDSLFLIVAKKVKEYDKA